MSAVGAFERLQHRVGRSLAVSVVGVSICLYGGATSPSSEYQLALSAAAVAYGCLGCLLQRLSVRAFQQELADAAGCTRSELVVAFERVLEPLSGEFSKLSPDGNAWSPYSLARRWRHFCSPATNEEQVEPALADVRRLQKRMEREGCGRSYINIVTGWHVFNLVTVVCIGGARDFLMQVLPLARLFGKLCR